MTTTRMLFAAFLIARGVLALEFTCHISGSPSGPTDFAGPDAVEQAFRALEAEDSPGGATVTITESGVYTGVVAVSAYDILLTVAPGVSAVLTPPDSMWEGYSGDEGLHMCGTVVIGQRYDGTRASGSLHLMGDSPENRIVVESRGLFASAYDNYARAPGSTLTNVEFRNKNETWTTGVAVRISNGEVLTNCYWNGDYHAGITYGVQMQALVSQSQSPPVFNDCVFDRCLQGVYARYTDVLPSATLNNCAFSGGSAERVSYVLLASNGLPSTDLILNGCTFRDLGDPPISVTNGARVRLLNSHVDATACESTVFANVNEGWLYVEGCTIEGVRLACGAGTNTGVGPNIIIERSRLVGTGVLNISGEGATIEAPASAVVTNTIFEGDGGEGPLVVAHSAHEDYPTQLTLVHCTLFGEAGYLLRSLDEDTEVLARYCIFDGSQCTGGPNGARVGWASLHPDSDHNLMWDGSGGAGWAGDVDGLPGTVTVADPLLDGAGRLTEGSPALEQAFGSDEPDDIDGLATRPDPPGTEPDLGAHESPLQPAGSGDPGEPGDPDDPEDPEPPVDPMPAAAWWSLLALVAVFVLRGARRARA